MKPIIGVMPLYDDEKDSLWMLPGYFDGIIEAGGVPIMLPLIDSLELLTKSTDMCDGFLFTGGHDVSPSLYNEEPINETVSCCPTRDRMELIVLDIAKKTDKPILGICRGIQFINAAHGGSLYQDIPTGHPTETEHHQKPPYDIPIHSVTIFKGTPLYNLIQADDLKVNSYHHQAIRELSKELKTMAISEDGLIEAVYHPEYKFLWGVQWHPEFSHKSDGTSKAIFKAFIEACE